MNNYAKIYRTLTGIANQFSPLAVLHNGDLASSGENYSIKIWNANDGSTKKLIYGHNGNIRTLAVLRNGNLVSGSEDSTIKIWTKNGDLLKTLSSHSTELFHFVFLRTGTLRVAHGTTAL